MSSIHLGPLVAGSPLLYLLTASTVLALSACTEPEPVDWPLQSSSRAVSSGFGPRLKASEDFRYDFHRGIDLPTPYATPVIALADGVVRIGGTHPSYEDGVIQVAHGDGCSGQPENCWFATYIHTSESMVAEGETVRAGQVLGYSGASKSGFEHLHFEVRDGTVWQQGAVNPVAWLDLPDQGAPTVSATLEGDSVVVDVDVGARDLDLDRLVIEVVQPGGKIASLTDWSAADWNSAFTHPSTDWPARDCPHAHVHPEGSAYNPHIHLDDPQFNGVHLTPEPFDQDTETWRLRARVPVVLEDASHVRVRATDLAGAEVITLVR